MTKARKFLLTTTAGLAIIFGGCTGRSAQALAAPAVEKPAASVMTVMKDYNTAATQQLKGLEASFNKDRPAGTPAIVYVDYDQVATWFSMQEGPDKLDKAVGDYLAAKTGQTYDAKTLAQLAQAMDQLKPAAFTPQPGGNGACLVVPEFPGISFDSFYAASFQVGTQNPLNGKIVLINLSTQEFGDFANAHEGWHCLDTRYRDDTGTGLQGAVKDNRAEMFADLGGVMEGIRNGANLTLIDKIAAERATWVFLTGPARAAVPESHEDHYKSIVYNTHSGLYALKAKIQEMGIDNFRKLNRAEMRDLAYEIVDAHALNYTQAAGLQSYYATGKAPLAVQGDIAQLKAIADASVRNATPQEIAARKAAGQDAGSATALQAALKARAGELGDAASFTNQLKARQEMTDRLRGRLSSNPSAERTTEAQLKLLLYSDPHLSAK